MTGKETIELFQSYINPAIANKIQVQAAEAQMKIHDMHSRAIACHCECMGMEVENSFAMVEGKRPLYRNKEFSKVLIKWGLVDESNKPII